MNEQPNEIGNKENEPIGTYVIQQLPEVLGQWTLIAFRNYLSASIELAYEIANRGAYLAVRVVDISSDEPGVVWSSK